MMRRAARLSPFLAVFWLLLSGHFTALLLALGALSIIVVVWIVHRIVTVDGIEIRARPSLRAPLYSVWLLLAVLKSSLSVLRQVWSIRPTLSPAVGSTTVADLSEVGAVVYANSITITPGTLSMQVNEDNIEVHALEESDLEELRAGGMLDRVRGAGAN